MGSQQIQAEYGNIPAHTGTVPCMTTNESGEVFWYVPRSRVPRSRHRSREDSVAERTVSRDPEADTFDSEYSYSDYLSPLPSPHPHGTTIDHMAVRVTDVPPALREGSPAPTIPSLPNSMSAGALPKSPDSSRTVGSTTRSL